MTNLVPEYGSVCFEPVPTAKKITPEAILENYYRIKREVGEIISSEIEKLLFSKN